MPAALEVDDVTTQPLITTDRLMTATEAGELVAMTTGALAQLRFTGAGPKFVKLGARSVRYRREDIEEWVTGHVRTRTGRQAY